MLVEGALEELVPVARGDFLLQVDGADSREDVPYDDPVDEMVHLGDAVLPQLLQLVALLEEDGVPEVQLRNQMAEGLQEYLLELI